MICSALDVVGDTESAIHWYETNHDPSLRGGAYLIIYGLLQTLYLQQDAVRHIYEALELPFQPPDTLKRIRQVRNETVGHPTNIGRGQAFVFVVQMTVGVNGFEYHKHGADGSFSSHTVDLRELVHMQREAVLELLRIVCRALREEWWKHMKRFSETKLSALLQRPGDTSSRRCHRVSKGSMIMHSGIFTSVCWRKQLVTSRASSESDMMRSTGRA